MMLKGKTSIVTGSTSGIGLGITAALAAEGCALMLNGFGDPPKSKSFGSISRASTAPTSPIPQPTCPSRRRSASWWRHFGGVDILVNNAGIQHVAKVVDFLEDGWDAVIAINMSAAFDAAKAALPHMLTKKWGRIINIASAHGLVTSGEKAAHVAAKHGIVGFTKVGAIETANDGATCNAI
jgi:3-hydroxybutyrate dehydrogenase